MLPQITTMFWETALLPSSSEPTQSDPLEGAYEILPTDPMAKRQENTNTFV